MKHTVTRRADHGLSMTAYELRTKEHGRIGFAVKDYEGGALKPWSWTLDRGVSFGSEEFATAGTARVLSDVSDTVAARLESGLIRK